MPKLTIICMANSRKHGGRCIAGLRVDTKGWIRPIPPVPSGPLQPEDYCLDDGSQPKVLDLVSIEFERESPDQYHPENWIIAKKPWKLLERPASSGHMDKILDRVTTGPELLGSCGKKVHKDIFAESPAQRSLTVIIPKQIEWRLKDEWQARVEFTLRGQKYDLPVTDCVWEERIKKMDHDSEKQAGFSSESKIMFTVSMGIPWEKDDCCYKLGAGVIVPSS